MNLLEETLRALADNHKSIDDVEFVTDGEHWCHWEEFAAASANYNYCDWIEWQEVNRNLKIVGNSWWLERCECDGTEWWEFKERPRFNTLINGKMLISEEERHNREYMQWHDMVVYDEV